MKLGDGDPDQLTYHLGWEEHGLFLAVLGRYPLIPPAHQPLSKHAPAESFQHGQPLLDEALAEQRKENRIHLKSLLEDPRRLRETEDGWQLIVSPADREWLLQVLNDVRVGSWIRLGSPEAHLEDMELDAEAAHNAMMIQMAGLFQLRLLEPPS